MQDQEQYPKDKDDDNLLAQDDDEEEQQPQQPPPQEEAQQPLPQERPQQQPQEEPQQQPQEEQEQEEGQREQQEPSETQIQGQEPPTGTDNPEDKEDDQDADIQRNVYFESSHRKVTVQRDYVAGIDPADCSWKNINLIDLWMSESSTKDTSMLLGILSLLDKSLYIRWKHRDGGLVTDSLSSKKIDGYNKDVTRVYPYLYWEMQTRDNDNNSKVPLSTTANGVILSQPNASLHSGVWVLKVDSDLMDYTIDKIGTSWRSGATKPESANALIYIHNEGRLFISCRLTFSTKSLYFCDKNLDLSYVRHSAYGTKKRKLNRVRREHSIRSCFESALQSMKAPSFIQENLMYRAEIPLGSTILYFGPCYNETISMKQFQDTKNGFSSLSHYETWMTLMEMVQNSSEYASKFEKLDYEYERKKKSHNTQDTSNKSSLPAQTTSADSTTTSNNQRSNPEGVVPPEAEQRQVSSKGANTLLLVSAKSSSKKQHTYHKFKMFKEEGEYLADVELAIAKAVKDSFSRSQSVADLSQSIDVEFYYIALRLPLRQGELHPMNKNMDIIKTLLFKTYFDNNSGSFSVIRDWDIPAMSGTYLISSPSIVTLDQRKRAKIKIEYCLYVHLWYDKLHWREPLVYSSGQQLDLESKIGQESIVKFMTHTGHSMRKDPVMSLYAPLFDLESPSVVETTLGSIIEIYSSKNRIFFECENANLFSSFPRERSERRPDKAYVCDTRAWKAYINSTSLVQPGSSYKNGRVVNGVRFAKLKRNIVKMENHDLAVSRLRFDDYALRMAGMHPSQTMVEQQEDSEESQSIDTYVPLGVETESASRFYSYYSAQRDTDVVTLDFISGLARPNNGSTRHKKARQPLEEEATYQVVRTYPLFYFDVNIIDHHHDQLQEYDDHEAPKEQSEYKDMLARRPSVIELSTGTKFEINLQAHFQNALYSKRTFDASTMSINTSIGSQKRFKVVFVPFNERSEFNPWPINNIEVTEDAILRVHACTVENSGIYYIYDSHSSLMHRGAEYKEYVTVTLNVNRTSLFTRQAIDLFEHTPDPFKPVPLLKPTVLIGRYHHHHHNQQQHFFEQIKLSKLSKSSQLSFLGKRKREQYEHVLNYERDEGSDEMLDYSKKIVQNRPRFVPMYDPRHNGIINCNREPHEPVECITIEGESLRRYSWECSSSLVEIVCKEQAFDQASSNAPLYYFSIVNTNTAVISALAHLSKKQALEYSESINLVPNTQQYYPSKIKSTQRWVIYTEAEPPSVLKPRAYSVLSGIMNTQRDAAIVLMYCLCSVVLSGAHKHKSSAEVQDRLLLDSYERNEDYLKSYKDTHSALYLEDVKVMDLIKGELGVKLEAWLNGDRPGLCVLEQYEFECIKHYNAVVQLKKKMKQRLDEYSQVGNQSINSVTRSIEKLIRMLLMHQNSINTLLGFTCKVLDPECIDIVSCLLSMLIITQKESQ
jgi:hypothetical protein